MGDKPHVVTIWQLENLMDRSKLNQTAKRKNDRLKADERRLYKELLERVEVEEEEKVVLHPALDHFKAYIVGDCYVMSKLQLELLKKQIKKFMMALL